MACITAGPACIGSSTSSRAGLFRPARASSPARPRPSRAVRTSVRTFASSAEDAEKDAEIDRLRNELNDLRGELNGARFELERWANETDEASASAGADALMEIERLRRQKQVTEETLLRDKEKGLQDMQRVLKETENRAREAEEGKKKTEDSLRFFTQQHHEKVKELEQRFAEQKDTAEKKEWYLGEARADLERARGALERAEKDLETAKKDLENAKNQSEEVQAELRDMRHAKDAAVSAATAAQKIIAERDSALDASGEECRGE